MKYSELPAYYKNLIIDNCEAQNTENRIGEHDDISYLFRWCYTPEGGAFWSKVNNSETVDELPDMPDYGIRGMSNNMEYTKEYFDNQKKGPKHYSSMKIEPIDYILENELGWCEANVIKYVTRHKQKGGEKDIKKAIHYLELLLEHEYNNGEN